MRLISLVSAFLLACSMAAQAQGFFVGKTVSILIPSNPGGGIDAYSRLVARHLGRHIDGQPNVTVQNVPGAGGLRALNLMVSRMPQDGTVILNVYKRQICDTGWCHGSRFEPRADCLGF